MSAVFRYRVTLAYDGTAYAGWQSQADEVTIQDTVEAALSKVYQEAIRVHASGRTDRGVHARGQIIHFDLPRRIAVATVQKSLNALLPADIRVMRAARAPADFHARLSAVEKEYRYTIWNAEVLPPHERLTMTRIRGALDLEAMREAASILEGRHDFASFTANPNRVVESTVRTVHELSLSKRGSVITIRARGEGFLYKMVRSLAGHLIRVGMGRIAPTDTRTILEARERTARVETAPPQGLTLWRVRY